jgi:hypothetical protein
MARTIMCFLAAGVLLGMCAGCQEQFTRQRYETIYVGQPAFEVEKTLGTPDARFSDTWTYLHSDPFYKAIIEFEDSRVTNKAWYDENEMGRHPDLDDQDDESSITVDQGTRMIVE